MLELFKFQVHTMPRQKRGSAALEKAEKRIASLKSISPTLDLGDGLTVENKQQVAELLRSHLATYNESLSIRRSLPQHRARYRTADTRPLRAHVDRRCRPLR